MKRDISVCQNNRFFLFSFSLLCLDILKFDWANPIFASLSLTLKVFHALIAFRRRRTHTIWVFLCAVHKVATVYIQAISRFGRRLGPAWHILPRSHVSFNLVSILWQSFVLRWNGQSCQPPTSSNIENWREWDDRWRHNARQVTSFVKKKTRETHVVGILTFDLIGLLPTNHIIAYITMAYRSLWGNVPC